VIPFSGDRLFWGQRVADLGVGNKPIPRKQLTVEKLSHAIQQAITDLSMWQRAADLSIKIRAEDGITEVVKLVREIEQEIAWNSD
jgi:sterol 3beta-glucosyltransferase